MNKSKSQLSIPKSLKYALLLFQTDGFFIHFYSLLSTYLLGTKQGGAVLNKTDLVATSITPTV